MSRQQSPSATSNLYPTHHQHHSGQHHPHHGAPLAPSTSSQSAIAKQRSLPKNYTPGITAGAEDSKYQAKYKELKKKVKEIELDNDKLYLKLLLAKKNIRRMNLERAILYERLAAVPPTPGRHPQDLPPESDPLFAHPPPPQDNGREGLSEAALQEYLRAHPDAHVVQGHHGRPVAIEENPNGEVRAAPGLPPPPPPAGIPVVYSFRHDSAPGPDPRYAPPLPGAPVQSAPAPAGLRDPYDDPPMSNARSIPPPPPPPQHGLTERTSSAGGGWGASQEHLQHREHRSHSNASSSHQHHRRHHSRDLDLLQADREREREPRERERDIRDREHGSGRMESRSLRRSSISSQHEIPPPPPDLRSTGGTSGRRHDLHEITHGHDTRHGGHPHQHIQIATTNLPPPSSPPLHSPTNSRSGASRHVHGHQRIGPGAHIHREPNDDPEYLSAIKRGQEMERARERERQEEMRMMMAREEEEMRLWRQDHGLMGPGIPHAATHNRSRSDTPGSGSGHDNNLSRPPSGQSYERGDRDSRGARYASSATVHHQNLLGLEHDQGYGDQIHGSSRDRHLRHAGHGGHSHSHSHGSHGYPAEASDRGGGRKRGYAEMDVDDSERGGGSGSGSGSLRSPLDGHPGSMAAGLSGDSLEHHHHHHNRKRMRSPMLSRVMDDSMDEDD